MRKMAFGDDFPDFTIHAVETPDVDYEAGSHRFTQSGTAAADFVVNRDALSTPIARGYTRNTVKPGTLTDAGALPYVPFGRMTATIPAGTVTDSITQTQSNIVPPPDPIETTLTTSIGLSCVFGFFRGDADKKCKLYFVANVTFNNGHTFLAIYSPVGDDADFKKIYGFTLPDDTDTTTYTEIDEDGPTLFGVGMKLWGYSIAIEHPELEEGDGPGHENYTPSLTVST